MVEPRKVILTARVQIFIVMEGGVRPSYAQMFIFFLADNEPKLLTQRLEDARPSLEDSLSVGHEGKEHLPD